MERGGSIQVSNSHLLLFSLFSFSKKERNGMEWNVDSRGCGPAFFSLFFFWHSFDSKKYNFNTYKRIFWEENK